MYRSPLLKTVQRHTRIAAVTHAPVHIPTAPDADQGQFLHPARPAGTEQPVKASWVPNTASLGASTPTIPPIPVYFESAPIQPELAEKPNRMPAVAEAKVIEPSGTARRDIHPSQSVGDDDNLWRRLQSIFNRHQEKERQEEGIGTDNQLMDDNRTEAQPSEQISSPGEASQTANLPGSTAAAEPTAGPIQRKEASPLQKRADNQPTALKDPDEETTQSEKEKEPQATEQTGTSSLATLTSPAEWRRRSELSAATDPPIAENPTNQTQADLQTTLQPRSASLTDVQRKTDNAKIATRETHMPADKMLLDSSAAEAMGHESTITAGEGTAPDMEPVEDGISLHPAPLQSVWPVQEKATESELPDLVPPPTRYQSPAQVDGASTYAAPKAHGMERTTLSQDFGQIQSRLEQVRTIPSDSSIEYIPPRRPHPLSQPTQPAKPANLVQRQPEDADQHTQPVQTEAEPRSFQSAASFETVQPSPSGIQEEHSPEPVDKLPIAPALPLQRFKDESSSPEMVGTEIGEPARRFVATDW